MFFMQDRFFRGLRLVLALDPGRVALGEVVIDAIENEYIPELEKKLEREPDEGKQAEIQELMGVWSDYANRNSSQGRSWNVEGVKVLSNMGNKWGLSESEKEKARPAVLMDFSKDGDMASRRLARPAGAR